MPLRGLSMVKRSSHWTRPKTNFFGLVRPNANFACRGQFQKYQPREALYDLIIFPMPKYTCSSSWNNVMLLWFNLRPRDQMVSMSLNAFCKRLSTHHNTQMVTQIKKPSILLDSQHSIIARDSPRKFIHDQKVISSDETRN